MSAREKIINKLYIVLYSRANVKVDHGALITVAEKIVKTYVGNKTQLPLPRDFASSKAWWITTRREEWSKQHNDVNEKV